MNANTIVEGLTTFDPTLDRAVGIVAAYVGNHHVPTAELPGLIAAIHTAVGSLGKVVAPAAPEVAKATPAEIRKSIRPDGLVSFIDGKSYKTLKRHLTKQGHTPASYCAAYGLPADYPLTAPSYSAKRSELAKSLGLGVSRRALKAVV